ncbi:MAG: TIGR03086 family protein, partial [Streptomyces sp.]|nr:TIGR03086 family protein [Streptomyces sp.]
MADGFELLTAAHAYLLAAVRGVPADGWGSASPCSDWTVAQVLNHARLDQQALTMKIGGTPPAGDPFAPGTEPGADPVAELEAVLKDSAAAWESVRGAETVETPVGTMPPAQGA